jgi:hypothetical protein
VDPIVFSPEGAVHSILLISTLNDGAFQGRTKDLLFRRDTETTQWQYTSHEMSSDFSMYELGTGNGPNLQWSNADDPILGAMGNDDAVHRWKPVPLSFDMPFSNGAIHTSDPFVVEATMDSYAA